MCGTHYVLVWNSACDKLDTGSVYIAECVVIPPPHFSMEKCQCSILSLHLTRGCFCIWDDVDIRGGSRWASLEYPCWGRGGCIPEEDDDDDDFRWPQAGTASWLGKDNSQKNT